MEVLVISIGEMEYSKYSIPLIKRLCDHNNIKLTVLTSDIPQNIYNLHPSWLKVFSHDICSSDFVISWDCDLVPVNLYDMKSVFDINKYNLAKDAIYLRTGNFFNHKFKYNCGLIGIPRAESENLKSIYLTKGKDSIYPSWEQYHINDYIYDNSLPVYELDTKYNWMERDQLPDGVRNIHYNLNVNSIHERNALVKEHFQKYASNFGL